ncbi:division/cell wall cluster transcriptional repressor MraZ [Desulfopila sp. IMCC35006]|uniref:division/cell wall cluster transcriptional repressor MraZ n=1 Tax=Desulfopila sp. IMCC35006 TaxID=2569542 RepID=UPI0010ACA1CB|nr:division/cell wall cluster transcriptional repressor MraZ [Desulfopila sp. IMCC35006]TKB25303.1 division/cell wall cluster transcriptional repressor MraZ [Desulfopila sp. IMCC35006]
MTQNRFRGRTVHVLDAKGRLNLPSRFREVLRQSGSEMLMVGPWKTHLRAYRMAEWEALETKLLTQGGEPWVAGFIRYTIGGAAECPIDKQGRIRIPPELRQDANLNKEIALTGMMDYIEICDQEASLAAIDTTREKFEEHQADLARMGIL